MQLHVYLSILSSRTKFNQLVGLFYLMLTFGYSEVCPGKCEWQNEETRIYSALVVNISRAESWSDSTVLKQMSADLPCSLWQTVLYVMREASSYTLLDGLCYSELDRAGIILTTGLCGLRGCFPQTRENRRFWKKVKKVLTSVWNNSKIQLFDRHTLSQSPTVVR